MEANKEVPLSEDPCHGIVGRTSAEGTPLPCQATPTSREELSTEQPPIFSAIALGDSSQQHTKVDTEFPLSGLPSQSIERTTSLPLVTPTSRAEHEATILQPPILRAARLELASTKAGKEDPLSGQPCHGIVGRTSSGGTPLPCQVTPSSREEQGAKSGPLLGNKSPKKEDADEDIVA
jgi:hypothetical protein